MIVFIVERGGKEELLKIGKLPFKFGKSNSDFSDPSLQEDHFILLGTSGDELVGLANHDIIYNGEKLRGEIHIKLNDELELGNIKLTLVQVDTEDIEIEEEQLESLSQPTQFLNIDETDIAYLKFLSGPEAGRILELDHSGVIGRDPSVDYVVEDPYISRRQAKIHVLGDKYELEDIGGKNPTLVNGKVLKGRKELHSGDEIQMGKTRALFINPKEKPESEILKSRGVPRWVYGALIALIIALAGLGTAFYFYQKNQTYTSYINLAQGTLGSLNLFESSHQKVKELESALQYLEKAEKIKSSEKIDNLKQITEKYLNAWKHVEQAEKLIKEGKLNEAMQEIEKTKGVLLNRENGEDDPYVLKLYDNLLKTLFVQQTYAEAKALLEKGKPDEALQVLNIALKRVPDHPQLQELKNIIVESKKGKKKISKEEVKRKLARLKKVAPPKKKKEVAQKPAQPGLEPEINLNLNLENLNLEEVAQPKISLDTKLDEISRLRTAYEVEHDLDKTIRLATKILERNPNDPKAKYYWELATREKKARRYEDRGQYKKALSIWRSILRLDKSNKWAQEAIVRLSINEG